MKDNNLAFVAHSDIHSRVKDSLQGHKKAIYHPLITS